MQPRFAILCPGQGGQHAGMFDLIRNDPRGQRALAELQLDVCLPEPLETLLRNDDLLFANRYAQPLIVAAGLAAWLAMRDVLPPADLVAGYSVGELTAYGVAQAWPPAQTMRLAVARAQAMDAAVARGPRQGLMSVGGVPVETIEQALQGRDAWVAIKTGFDTAIMGGSVPALQAAQPGLFAAGARTSLLPVGAASHTPLMAGAIEPFSQALAASGMRDPAMSVIAGIDGQPVHQNHAAITALLRQLVQPIRWDACMDACSEQGITVALELGPGAALSRMLRERHPAIECRSIAEFRSLDGVIRWLGRRLEG